MRFYMEMAYPCLVQENLSTSNDFTSSFIFLKILNIICNQVTINNACCCKNYHIVILFARHLDFQCFGYLFFGLFIKTKNILLFCLTYCILEQHS